MIENEYRNLRELLIKHEGIRLKPYLCPAGKLTVGVGRNLEDVGLSDQEARMMLTNDIHRVVKETADNFKWFKSLNLARQDVVLSMVFNLGLTRFRQFKKMHAWLSVANYDNAANEMLSSVWASQVGIRAVELATMMRHGNYPMEKG